MTEPSEHIQIRVIVDQNNGRAIKVRNSRTLDRHDIWLPLQLIPFVGEAVEDGTSVIAIKPSLARARGLIA